MSNIALFNSGAALPSYLKTVELDETTKNLAGNAGGGGKRISIRGSVFRMLVNGEELMINEDRAMNVIVVASSVVGRTYYEGAYDEAVAAKAPTCWSADGAKPNEDVKEPQATTCMSCPQNIKGSGQGESRACRYSQRLAVVLEGDMSGDVYQLSLPATSIFGSAEQGQKMPMQAYARFLAQYKIPVGAVITEMRFDTSSATPKLTFSAVRPLTEAEYQVCKDQGNTEEAKRAITMTVSQTDAVQDAEEPFQQPAAVIEPPKPVAKPAAAKPAPAPKAEPAPVVVDEPEVLEPEVVAPEVIAEPTKVEKPAEAPEVNAEISNLLDEWEV
jgi:hypothetical protein